MNELCAFPIAAEYIDVWSIAKRDHGYVATSTQFTSYEELAGVSAC